MSNEVEQGRFFKVDMKYPLMICGLFGLAAGVFLRQADPGREGEQEATSSEQSQRSQVQRDSGMIDTELSWGVRGGLTIEEILALPRGAHRLAETALWASAASPEEIGKHWDQLSNDRFRNRDRLGQLMELWIAKDRNGAFDHVKKTAGEQDFFEALARTDPEAALAQAKGRGWFLWGKALAVVAENDPAKGLELLGECSSGAYDDVVEGIAAGLMKEDPKLALDFIKSSGVHKHDTGYLNQWASFNNHPALDWALENEGWGLYPTAEVFLEKDSDYFVKQLDQLPTGSLQQHLQAVRAGWMAKRDPDQAVELAREMPVGLRTKMLLAIGPHIGADLPELRNEILGDLLSGGVDPVGPDRDVLDKRWVSEEMRRDPARFIALAEIHDRSLLPKVATCWVAQDAGATYAWMAGIPKGTDYDRIAVEVVNQQLDFFRSGFKIQSGFEDLLEIVNGVSSPQSHQDAELSLMTTWRSWGDLADLKRYMESGEATAGQMRWWRGGEE